MVTAQPLPSLDPAFANTRQSRAVANALCTPLVRYADAEGLPGTVIVPGLARDLPVIARGSRTFRIQLLAGLHFSDGRPLTAQDVKATFERLLDPATGSPGAALFNEIVGAKTFLAGEDPHLRGVRANGGLITISLKRSDPAFLARLAMPIACPVQRATPHREVPDCSRASRPAATASSSTARVADRPRARQEPTAVPNGGAPGAAARISITRLPDAAALQAAIRSGTADLSLDDLPVDLDARARGSVVGARASCASIPRAGRSPTSACGARSRSRSTATCSRSPTAATSCPRARSCSIRRRRPRSRPIPSTARALLRAAGAEGTLQLALWAEPGTQARVARAIASQFAAIGVGSTCASRPRRSGPRRARLDRMAGRRPTATRRPSSCRSRTRCHRARRRAIAKRVRRTARLAGDARRAAFRRLDERLGGGGLGAIPLLRANFSTPISSMLVGRGTHPVFDVDLALLSTRP